MGDYLTPAEVELRILVSETIAPYELRQWAATLRAMAEIVEAVATKEAFDLDDTCIFCHQYLGAERLEHMNGGHASDCTYLRARKVRGYE